MNNMMLIKSSWKGHPTFKLIPTTENCVYVEGIYDRELNVLALIGNIKKQQFHMLPKIDANGDPEVRKSSKEGNQRPFKEERRAIETFQEYYLEDPADIDYFINSFAVNKDGFNYKEFFAPLPQPDASQLGTISNMMKLVSQQ